MKIRKTECVDQIARLRIRVQTRARNPMTGPLSVCSPRLVDGFSPVINENVFCVLGENKSGYSVTTSGAPGCFRESQVNSLANREYPSGLRRLSWSLPLGGKMSERWYFHSRRPQLFCVMSRSSVLKNREYSQQNVTSCRVC